MRQRNRVRAIGVLAIAGLAWMPLACNTSAPPEPAASTPTDAQGADPAFQPPAPSPEPAPPAQLAPAPPPAAPAAPAPPRTPSRNTTGAKPSTPAAVPAPAAPASPSSPAAPPVSPAPPPVAAAPPPPPPPPAPPRTFTLKADREIAVNTTATLSTKTNKVGDTFTATLAKAITDGDWEIAKEGARVGGVIVTADAGGRVKGLATMGVALRTLQLADGRTIELTTSTFTQDAKTSKKQDAAKVGIAAGLGAAIGAIAGGGKGAAIGAAVGGGAGTGAALATRGDAAEIPAETQLTFTLAQPVTVTKVRSGD